MTTRDPRTRPPGVPEPGREPTQSLHVDPDDDLDGDPDEQSSHPSLAVGTSDVGRGERTKIESPNGRNKTPVPRMRAGSGPPPIPDRGTDDPVLHLGSVLGTYRLAELLGKGGMGYVYRAEHVKLGREVALKLLRADYARRRDAVLRFFQEAKTVNRVRHRNIVDVTDFVELDDGTTFIIMEFLRGQSLGKWARTGVDLPRALAVLVQICDGLGAAHAVGVIHRDLKPDNVIVVPTSDGAELVKLLDFGVAKLLNRDDEDLGFQTAAGSVIGTPAYMSPEQAGGMAIDHRSDIYSLGAIMYELFCGQPMFRGRSFGEYVRKHLTEMPIPPRQTEGGANIDPRLEALILRSLAKDPNERFGHILELRDGLLHMLGAVDTPAPPYAMMQSGLRPPPTTQLPPHMLPLPAPAMVTTVPTPQSAMASALHPSLASAPHPSLAYNYSQLPPPEPQAGTPWWLWLIGGVFAVGLGVAGAVWYAGHESGGQGAESAARTAPPAAAPTPTATPIEPAAAQPQIIELQFDSLPEAGVYEEGHSAELCKTPCTFEVNLADGGARDRRKYVVHAEGYRDDTVDVDLSGSQHKFNVTLEQLAPATPEPVATPEPAGSDDHADDTDHPEHAGHKSHRGHGKATHTHRTADHADKNADADTKPADTKPADTKPADTKPADTKIDRTDTLDPFHRSSP